MTVSSRRYHVVPNDRRSRGSMTQAAREILSLQPTGWTRSELRHALRSRPSFRAQFQRNPAAYNNMVLRLIARGDICERDGKLFASEPVRLSYAVREELFELNRGAYANGH